MISKNENSAYVPAIDPLYVKTNFYDDLRTILESKFFFPVLITGPSGIAKTMTVTQICGELGLEMMRVNLTIESDEDSLMGGFRLVEGDTVFHRGPVIEAMERGCVLLLDEFDLASTTKIMCLQSVTEGRGYFIKRTNEWVQPAPGFMIVATANTKGQGDLKGKYLGTQMMNEAALDRFPITLEAEFPLEDQEIEILNRVAASIGLKKNSEEISTLVRFAKKVRDTVANSTEIEYNISTRRLTNILQAYRVFGDLEKAFAACIARFDEPHKQSYTKILRAMLPSGERPLEPENEEVDYSNIPGY